MGTFVQVRLNRFDSEEPIFCGQLCASTLGLVSDYRLIDLASMAEVAALANYPRCTETGLMLFARLLAHASPLLLDQALAGILTVSINVGARASSRVSDEFLLIRTKKTHALTWLLSPAAIVSGLRVPLPRDGLVCTAIRECLASALGLSKSFPPPPRPLTDTPVHRRADGSQYVRLCDLPSLTRRFLQVNLRLDSRATEVEASRWLAFLEKLTSAPSQPNAPGSRWLH